MACNKMAFPTMAEALKEIKVLRSQQIRFSKRHQRRKSGQKMTAYQCPHCGLFHLTTAKQHRKY